LRTRRRCVLTVVVVGAGPAGLAAAAAARSRGASVLLLDSADQLGGQLWRHPPAAARDPETGQHGWPRFTAMRDALLADPGCEVVTSAQVWALEPRAGGGATLHLLIGPPDAAGRTPRTVEADALVLATGAHDRTLPFPG